jgi:glutamyl-tRNA reductase
MTHAGLELQSVVCLSFSSRLSHQAPLRESVSLSSAEQETILPEWKQTFEKALKRDDISLFYLGTCHRIEIFAFGIPPEELLAAWSQIRGTDVFRAQIYTGVSAVEHWARVSSSLDSEVLGETQITGQMKDSLEFARSRGLLKGTLDRCAQQILKITKKIRNESRIGEGTVSVAHVAVDGLQDVFEVLEDKSALLVGAGPMAIQSLERLFRLGLKKVTWVNRSREKIESHALATHVRIADFSQLALLTWQHHVSIFATASPQIVLKRQDLITPVIPPNAVSGPRILLDLGLPRNVDPEIHRRSDFFVRNVDEFRDRAGSESDRRKIARGAAETILATELSAFQKTWQHWTKAPQIAEIHRHFEERLSAHLHQLKLEENSEIGYEVKSLFSNLLHQLTQVIEELDEERLEEVVNKLTASGDPN